MAWIRRLGTKRSGFRYVDAERSPGARQARRWPASMRCGFPPAWRDVHIAPTSRTAIQAWGFDARGRKQYRYNERAVERRELRKYHRVRQLAKDLPRVRVRCTRTRVRRRAPSTLDADTVAATVLRLISETFCRVGGERYEKENGTFGITTLRKSHVQVRDGTRVRSSIAERAAFGSGRSCTDRDLVRLVARQLRTPGPRLFRYQRDGRWHVISARDVNNYLQRAGRRVQREGFSHLGRNAARGDGARRAGAGEDADRSEAERRARDAARVVGARQHAGDLPEVVRSSDRHRPVSRRGRDDSATARAPDGGRPRSGAFAGGACADRVSRPALSRAPAVAAVEPGHWQNRFGA